MTLDSKAANSVAIYSKCKFLTTDRERRKRGYKYAEKLVRNIYFENFIVKAKHDTLN